MPTELSLRPAAPGARAGRPAVAVLTLTSLAVAAFAVLPYLTSSLDTLARDDVGLAAGYAGAPPLVLAAFYVHVVAGGLALVCAPLQLWAGLRRGRPRVHRWVGRTYVVAVAVGGTSGLVLAPVNQAGLVGALGFGALAVLWLWTTWRGYRAVRAHDVGAHRDWMTRSFALTYAGVTLRLWTTGLVAAQALVLGDAVSPDAAFDRAYALVPFLSWVPNLVVAELVVRRRRRARERPGAVGHPPR
ncbi:DUF2306 domain-containing protein [Cellulosimicrobium sp. NPDC057127]|uniref:DUF2306 domain-containing protein n=1 Tax=Cellulosimicrobium sp. NPDC057127 TaxID=3346026 RepID=UPI003624DD52